jgi:hypothetical protein
MNVAADLTPREVAELSHVPKRVIEKAIEERSMGNLSLEMAPVESSKP